MKYIRKCANIFFFLCVVMLICNVIFTTVQKTFAPKVFVSEVTSSKQSRDADSVLDALTKIRQHLNGISQDSDHSLLANIIAKEAHSSLNTDNNLNDTFQKHENSVSESLNQHKPTLLTLITSWPHDLSKLDMHNITLANWMSFYPKVRVVVFSNESEIITYTNSVGVKTFPIIHHAGGGAPVLRAMFETTMEFFPDSALYGFANADIIFAESLTDTLEAVTKLTSDTTPLLLIGQRTNVMNVTSEESSTYAGIRKMASSRGKLFDAFAEDFFITNKKYPWYDVADVIIGRRAYDNWIVAYSICTYKCNVIDVTSTMLAVHQTTVEGGNFEGSKHNDTWYNDKLLKKVGKKVDYLKGYTHCTRQQTVVRNNSIQLQQRANLNRHCNC